MRPAAERFWEKVQKTAKCWLWTAATDRDGYGVCKIQQKQHRAHRVAWELSYGTIPSTACVLHKCDNLVVFVLIIYFWGHVQITVQIW